MKCWLDGDIEGEVEGLLTLNVYTSFNWNPSIQFPPRITVSAGSSSRCSAASFSILSWQILRCSWDILSLQCFLGRLWLDFPGKPLTGVTQESSWSDVWTKSADCCQYKESRHAVKESLVQPLLSTISFFPVTTSRPEVITDRADQHESKPSVSASSSPPQSKQRCITADVTPICWHSRTRPRDTWSPLVSFNK